MNTMKYLLLSFCLIFTGHWAHGDTSNNETVDCNHNKADIVFLLDASYSEGIDNFRKQLSFVINFTKAYQIGPDKLQISVVTFSTQPFNAFYLNTYADKADLLTAIKSIPYKAGGTYTDKALEFVRTSSFTVTHGARYGVPKILVVMTDGQSSNPSNTAVQGRVLYFSDIRVITIGIGSGVVETELLAIASDPKSMFTVPSFDTLQTIATEIQSATCVAEIIDPTTCEDKTADIVFVLDASSSEGAKNFKLQLDFVSNVADTFVIGPNDIQVSLVTFSTHAYNNFFLNEYTNNADLRAAIQNATYLSGTTHTYEALQFVKDVSFKAENGGRTGAVSRLVVVLTDGNSNSASTTAKAAEELQHTGARIISVGIGSGVSSTELTNIASDINHVFTVSDFDALESITTQLETAACRTPATCGPIPTDIVFVVDSSTSMGAAGFQKALDFVTYFVRQFDIGPSDVQASMITYSSSAHTEFYLDTYKDKAALIAGIQSAQYKSGTTDTGNGIRYAASYHLTTTHGARINASHVLILITAGPSKDLSKTITEARGLQNRDIEMIAIGVGGSVSEYELNSIASDRNHVFNLGSVEILHTLQSEVFNEACTAGRELSTTASGCGSKPTDIVFVLDSSSSEGLSNFQKQVIFVRDFLYKFDIGPDAIQVSVVVFSSGVYEQFPLNMFLNQSSLLNALAKISYHSGSTNTDKALKFVRENSFNATRGDRVDASNLVIVITDGQSTNPTRTAEEAALLQNKALVIAIGIGSGVKQAELDRIASDSNYTLEVANFDALQTLDNELLFVTCDTCEFLSHSDIVFVLDASSSETSIDFQKQLDFVSRLVNDFSIGADKMRIGVVTFGDTSSVEIQLNDYSDKATLLSAIQQIPYRQGATNTDLGLQIAREQMFTSEHGARNDVNQYTIVVTAAGSANTNAALNQANLLKQSGVEVISIGVGADTNKDELTGLASDGNHVFTVTDFNSLLNIREDIKRAGCEEVTTTVLPTTTPLPNYDETTEPIEVSHWVSSVSPTPRVH